MGLLAKRFAGQAGLTYIMNSLKRIFGNNTDIFLVVGMLGILIILFTPIPSNLLDFLLLANLSFALLILLLTFYVAKPVDFSTFPPLLLIATLFRLSLNIAATRLILSNGDAGRVIGAIGSYVVQGNYVIGLLVFLIFVVVQNVVVTNGAQRVAEEAARFTLDSMTGKQMSIDADLNMGFIDQAEAQRRRKNIEKEANFYGAMDGASKFVKGDALWDCDSVNRYFWGACRWRDAIGYALARSGPNLHVAYDWRWDRYPGSSACYRGRDRHHRDPLGDR